MNPNLLQKFIQLITDRTGLHIREQDREALSNKIFARIKLLKLSLPEQYYQLLDSQSQASKNEWEKLIVLLTVTESYFFRDRGQLKLLKNVILPEIIQQKKTAKERSIRLWSAGCSTGEEAYSLAILIRELLPNWQEWNILILGTDINDVALAKAKEGIYSHWSFRLLDDAIQRKYFYRYKGDWKLDQQVKNMVKFSNVNLVKDNFPGYIDLILCRNVFVYFESKYILLVLEKFSNSLIKKGYLMTGHAELYGLSLGKFQVNVFPESLVYQRSSDWNDENSLDNRLSVVESYVDKNDNLIFPLINKSLTKKSLVNPAIGDNIDGQKVVHWDIHSSQERSQKLFSKSTNKEQQTNDEIILLEAETLFHRKAYTDAIKKAEQVIGLNPENFGAYKLLAQLYANLGEYSQAIFYCNKAIEVNSFSLFPYYLLVNIAEEQGDLEKAKSLLKRIIYLCPLEIAAYIELGSLYSAEGNMIRAKKMKQIALELLKKLPANATVEYKGEIPASELIKYLENS